MLWMDPDSPRNVIVNMDEKKNLILGMGDIGNLLAC
jgi:hypothetical protein